MVMPRLSARQELDSNVPLPSNVYGRRLLELDFEAINLTKEDWILLDPPKLFFEWLQSKVELSKPTDFDIRTRAFYLWSSHGGIPGHENDWWHQAQAEMEDTYIFDGYKAAKFWIELALQAGIIQSDIDQVFAKIQKCQLINDIFWLDTSHNSNPMFGWLPKEYMLKTHYEEFLVGLRYGRLIQPSSGWSGGVTSVTQPETAAEPKLFLVEKWGISSFLGTYGVGKTVKAISLLPGETLNIRTRTWQSTSSSRTAGSSIIDSHTDEAAEKFGNQMQEQTTDKSTRADKKAWHVEAEANASWGWGSAKVSGGMSGESQAAREAFAQNAKNVTTEHARNASDSRQNTVTIGSEQAEKKEDEVVIERTISNINLRRTLNFVFRELNQEYITKIHLIDVRVGYTDGSLNSWKEVPITALKGLLDKVLKNKKDEVAKYILGMIGICYDVNGDPIPMLEKCNYSSKVKIVPRDIDLNNIEPPSNNVFYRMKRGFLGQKEDEDCRVHGVVVDETKIVMRTDSLVVDAVLGNWDALDDYALETQKSTATAKQYENERTLVETKKIETATDQLVKICEDPSIPAQIKGEVLSKVLAITKQ